MAYPGNQKALQAIYWILCEADGRDFLADLVGGRAATKTLNTTVKRGGTMGGETSLLGLVGWNDDHIIQTLNAIAGTAPAILNQTFTANGKSVNLAGLLASIDAKPAAQTTVTLDADQIASLSDQLRATLPASTVAALAAKLA